MEKTNKERHIISFDAGAALDAILKFRAQINTALGKEEENKQDFLRKAILRYIEDKEPLIWNKIQEVEKEALAVRRESIDKQIELIKMGFIDEFKDVLVDAES